MDFVECICSTRGSCASILREWTEIDWSAYRCIALAARFFSGQNRTRFKTIKFSLAAMADDKNVEIRSEERRHLILHEMPYRLVCHPDCVERGPIPQQEFQWKVLEYFSKHRTKRGRELFSLSQNIYTSDYISRECENLQWKWIPTIRKKTHISHSYVPLHWFHFDNLDIFLVCFTYNNIFIYKIYL